jgi:hypothetical protein
LTRFKEFDGECPFTPACAIRTPGSYKLTLIETEHGALRTHRICASMETEPEGKEETRLGNLTSSRIGGCGGQSIPGLGTAW